MRMHYIRNLTCTNLRVNSIHIVLANSQQLLTEVQWNVKFNETSWKPSASSLNAYIAVMLWMDDFSWRNDPLLNLILVLTDPFNLQRSKLFIYFWLDGEI